MTGRPRVLFISHSASRNGATILLLSLLRWLRPRVDWDIEILVNGRGDLLDDFRAIGKTSVWRDQTNRLSDLFGDSAASLQRSLVSAHARFALPRGPFDLVYANTSAAAPLVSLLGEHIGPVLWHVHELSYAMEVTLTRPPWLHAFRNAHRFVAVSEAVSAALAVEHRIEAARIDVVHGFIAPHRLANEEANAKRVTLRKRHCIPPEAFVVGGCGSLGWRKGSDLFLQIARLVSADDRTLAIHFLWVGGQREEEHALQFRHDMQRFGLGHSCSLVPATAEALDYYCAMDAFALTSREDPFPLVVLEAADHGLPTLCFEETGGAPEFVTGDTGALIPYLDIPAFADRIAQLARDHERTSRLGAQARAKVRQRHGLEHQAPKMLLAMQRCLTAGGGAVEDTDRPPARTVSTSPTH